MNMHGIFVIENYTLPDFEDLESKGLTDVFFADSNSYTNYSTFKANLNKVISAMKNTNLNLYLDEIAFFNAAGEYLPPSDEGQKEMICSLFSQICSDYPELKGIALDDYFWHSEWGTPSESEQNVLLKQYASEMATSIHDVDSKMIFAPSMGWMSHSIPDVADVSDMILVQCFYDEIYYTTPPYASLNYVLNHVTADIPVIPVLGTFVEVTGHPLRSTKDISEDICNVTRLQSPDYVLYSWPWVQGDLAFPPIKKYLNRNYVERQYNL